MSLRRARVTGLLLAIFACGPILGCAPSARGPGDEYIVEIASGRQVDRATLLAAIRAADYALLGELHDNPAHHARRAGLLDALGRDVAVVAEQLPREGSASGGAGKAVVLPRDARGDALRDALVAAGFDAEGWRWPIHEPLFAALARSRAPLRGGNLPPALARRIAREGESAIPAPLRAVVAAAPLSAQSRERLDTRLASAHCGALPAALVPGMRAAQRARDASMWLALRGSGTRPAVLLAGNGHVRSDYGVAQIAAALQASASVVSVGFLEHGVGLAGLPYTYAWITAPAARDDPCERLHRTAPAKRAPPRSPM